jgi:hypothetical protein
LVGVCFGAVDLLADPAMKLHQAVLDAYWHERHDNCTLQAECRAMCAILAIADAIAPEGDVSTAQIRAVLLAHVH